MPNRDVERALKPIALALWLFLAAIFLAYFTITNNAYLILYAFPLFVILGVLSAFSDKLSTYEIVGALAFIIAGSLLYMGKSISEYYGIFSIAAFFAVYIIDMKREYKIYSYFVLALPDLLYLLGFFANLNFAINTAIVGYYLLIGAVISIFISTAFGESKLHKIRKRFSPSKKTVQMMLYAAMVVAIVLIIAPIWPTGPSLSLGMFPHARISINDSLFEHQPNSSTVYYPVEVDYSGLSSYTTANLSNIQFFYGNGQEINSTLSQINETNDYVANLSLNIASPEFTKGIYAYFMPFNYSNYTTARATPLSNTSAVAKSAFGPISYSGGYVKSNVEIPVTSVENGTKKVKMYAFPYYTFDSFCAPGFNITYKASLSFSSNASFFELRNASDFINSISISGQSNYSNYKKSISKYSFGKFLNTKEVNTSFYTNKSCMFYIVLTNGTTNVNGHISYVSHRVLRYRNASVELPNLYMNISHYISNKYTFLQGGLSYLNSEYLNYSANKSK
jgi:hypothetical protein